MLGRKASTRQECDHCKAVIAEQLPFYKKLVQTITSQLLDSPAQAALDDVAGVFFTSLTLVLDASTSWKIGTGSQPRIAVHQSADFPPFIRKSQYFGNRLRNKNATGRAHGSLLLLQIF